LGAQAGVTKSIPANTIASGYPAREHMKARKEEAAIRRLPELLKRVKRIEKLLQLRQAEKNGLGLESVADDRPHEPVDS